jgi:hypothetical protein
MPLQYHILSGTISFRLQGSYISAISQARLNGVLGQTSMYKTFLRTPHLAPRFFKMGILLSFIVLYFILHRFIYRPSDSTVSEDAGIKPRTVATSALAVRRSHLSAISFTSRFAIILLTLKKTTNSSKIFLT